MCIWQTLAAWRRRCFRSRRAGFSSWAGVLPKTGLERALAARRHFQPFRHFRARSGFSTPGWNGNCGRGPPPAPGSGYVPGADFNALKLVRCDEAQWRLLGLSLAGYNAILSLGVALLALNLMRRPETKQAINAGTDYETQG